MLFLTRNGPSFVQKRHAPVERDSLPFFVATAVNQSTDESRATGAGTAFTLEPRQRTAGGLRQMRPAFAP